MQFVAGVLK